MDCVERNRSERAKIANVAEWKPPASTEAHCSLAEGTTGDAPCGEAQELRARIGGAFPLDLRVVTWYKLPVSTSTDRPGLANGHIFCARIPADLPPRFIQ